MGGGGSKKKEDTAPARNNTNGAKNKYVPNGISRDPPIEIRDPANKSRGSKNGSRITKVKPNSQESKGKTKNGSIKNMNMKSNKPNISKTAIAMEKLTKFAKSAGERRRIRHRDDHEYLQEPKDEKLEIPEVVKGYPPPKPPPTRKQEIFFSNDRKIPDQRATEVEVEDAPTFEDLARLLTEDFPRDIHKVRAIFSWMAAQKINERSFPANTTPNTPLDTLKKIKEGTTSYTTLFALMCRAADLPCVIIHGYAKSAGYEVGDKDIESLKNTWNAVFVAKGWRIVFPLWAFRVVIGRSDGKWTLVERKGEAVREKEEPSSGVNLSTINEYYFLTDPDEFIYRCLPINDEWQLVREKMTKEHFIEIPYCRPQYFLSKVKILSKFQGVLHAENGLCDISLRNVDEKKLIVTYELFYNDDESRDPIPSEIQLDRYVAVLNQNMKLIFSTRFPKDGVYKIDLQGGRVGEEPAWICSFKMICQRARKHPKPFPCNPDIGFGPSIAAEIAGLKALSHHKGLIPIRLKQEIEIQFKTTKKILVQTILVHNTIPSSKLKKHVAHRIVGDYLNITVDIPEKGEFALKINTKEKYVDLEYYNACNYLIASEEIHEKEKVKKSYESGAETRVRRMLSAGIRSKDPVAIQKAIDKFALLDIDDKGDLKRAQDKIHIIKLSKALRDGINRRNIELLENALIETRNLGFENRLKRLFTQAEETLTHLKKMKVFDYEILQMKQTTISEIHRYKQPQRIVVDVMKATYLLLGEHSELMEDWSGVQALMRRTRRAALLQRIKLYKDKKIPADVAAKAADLLRPHTEESAKLVSAGCGTFYLWACNMISENVEEKKPSNIEIVDLDAAEETPQQTEGVNIDESPTDDNLVQNNS